MNKLGAIRMTPELRNELLRIGAGMGAGGAIGAALAPEDSRLRTGVLSALADLGIMGIERVPDAIRHLRGIKLGSSPGRLHRSLINLITGPAGEHITRLPIAIALGGGAGYTIGKYMGSGDPRRQAATGAILPVVGTAATLSALPLRRALISALR